jgi:hypothetical protein
MVSIRKSKGSILLIGILILICNSCNRSYNDFNFFLQEKINGKDSCIVDIKDYFNLDYDTMYVFGAFTPIEGIRTILNMPTYSNEDLMMPKGFLVQDSQNKIVLIKNHKIVFDKDVSTPYLLNDGIEIFKEGIFDGEKIKFFATMYTSSMFKISKIKNDSGYNYVYIKNRNK